MTQPTNRRFVMEPRLDAEVATINTELNLKAPKASPSLTGTPTAPTAAVDTSTTQLATTAFVTNQAAAATSPMDGTAAVGTSKRYARQDHVHPTDTTRAPLASPALTGTPTSTTAAADTNTTQIATTAYVVGQASATAPVMDGTAATGTSLKYARADHVHPSDTSRSPLAGSSSITTVGTITSGTWNATDVALGAGGTNASLTAVNGGVVYSNATAMAITAAGTQDQVLKSNAAGAPTWQTLDLTYMPDAAYKKSVKAATTANITLSAPQTIDGIALVAGDRVLVKNQTAAAGNGIYVVQAAAWTRATDADTISEIAGATVNVDSGTQGSQIWSNNLKTTDTLGTTAMVWNKIIHDGDVIPAVDGGTGQTSYAVGDLLYAPTTTTVGKLADVATGNALISGGVGVAPSYGKIGLTTHVSGTLPLANGGTNAALTAVNGGAVYSSGSALAVTAAGTSGQVLKSNGAAAPTWQTNNLGSLSDVVITSPTAGQTIAYNGTNWINGSGGGGGVTASATAPASPVNGSAWFDTNDGTLYVYYTDANTSQWVEVQADSALGSQLATRMSTAESNITALTAKDGLVPVIPTSISVSAGSGSVAVDGTITFSSTGEVRINGVFSSTYKNYRIIHTSSGASANTGVSYRLRAAGVDYSTANQKYGVSYSGLPGAVANTGGSSETVQQIGWVEGAAGSRNVASVDIYSPFEAVHTGYTSVFGSYVGGTAFGYVPTTSSYDGITFSVTGTYSGTIKIYGYR